MAGPKALENCAHAQVMQDGNIQPVLCPDGGPSLAADALMRRMNFGDAVMNLQADASLAGVEAAMCSDKRISHMTNPMEFSVYEIRSLEVGWRYGYQPEDWLLSARC